MQEGYSTNRPPFFDGTNFQYWKSRMEYYLMTEIDLWFSVTEGYSTPVDEQGKVLGSAQWSAEQKRKAQANAKATVTLQCGVSREQLNKVGPFKSAQDLWNKLLELHEGTRDSRIAKRDLFLNQLQNFSMKDTESVSELHGRFKEVLNGLHSIGENVENRDLIRYVLKSFPRNALWSSMVDAYKVSKDLSTVKLDELFCEMELHEQANKRQKEKGIALVAGEQGKKKQRKKELSSSSSSESEEEEESSSSEVANFVRKMMRRSRRFNKKKGKPVNNISDKSNVVCYECRKQGHFRNECPRLKKKEEKKKRRKALRATWDETSSESSEEEEEKKGDKHTALMALEDSESDKKGEESDSASSSSDDEEVTSTELVDCYRTIAYLSDMLDKSKGRIRLLKTEIYDLKNLKMHAVENSADVSQFEELRDENRSLKAQVDDLKSTLEKFTNSSQTLNLILGSQRAVYNKAGIGYRPKQREVNFMSLISRNSAKIAKTVKAWIPKNYLTESKGPKIWVPKNCIFRV